MDKNSKEDIIELFYKGCTMLVFSFDIGSPLDKDAILRNFLAKSISQLMTISALNRLGQTLDCFIIYRSMVDRLAHLYFLERSNTYKEFEEWSFVKQFDLNNNSLSDTNFKDRIEKEFFKPSDLKKARYKELKEQGVNWKRPDIEKEFKQKDLYFIYKFGYDYASSHVHPMANDGMIEYFNLIPNPPREIVEHEKHQSHLITKNSTLVASLIVNECLNNSSLKWRAIVFNFIDSFRKAINDLQNEFELDFAKIKQFIDENQPLAQKNE